MVQRYQDGTRFHLRDIASKMVTDRFLEDQPGQANGKPGGKGSSSFTGATTSAPAGRVTRAFGSLAAAPPSEAEATSAAVATEAQARGVAACLVATEKATSMPPSAPSGAKGTAKPSIKGKEKGSQRERRGHGSTASPSATQNPQGKGKGKQLPADEPEKGQGKGTQKGRGKRGSYKGEKGRDPQPPWRGARDTGWEGWSSEGWSSSWASSTPWWERG